MRASECARVSEFFAARVTRQRSRTKRAARQNEPQVGAGFIHAKLSPQIVADVDQRALVGAIACRSVAIKGRATACANERSHTTTTTQKTTDKCIHSEHDEIKKHNKDDSRAWLVLCEVVLPHATRHTTQRRAHRLVANMPHWHGNSSPCWTDAINASRTA